MSQASRRISEQTQTLELHRDDAAYATTVQNNNVPLLLFNIGLVLAAAMLGYLNVPAHGERRTRRASGARSVCARIADVAA